VAFALGIACGGWCPRGRWAEDGRVPDRYPLVETPAADPAQRTAWNARDSDATLALARGAPQGGTALAVARARELGRPCLVVDLATDPDLEAARAWLAGSRPRVLNVAGPRESQAPGIGEQARRFLRGVLAPSAPSPIDSPRGETQRGEPSAKRQPARAASRGRAKEARRSRA
jgi:hypothetical protein